MRRGSSVRWTRRMAVAMTALGLAVGVSAAAHAQGVPPPAPEVASPPGAYPPAPPSVPPPPTVAAAAPPAEMPPGESDFDPNVRRWAIGYAGVSLVPTGNGTLTAPAFGFRYWMSPGSGIDVALGVGWNGGSTETAGTSTDKNSVFGVIAQGGVPIVLSAHKHVTFQVIPFLTLAYGRTSTGTGYTETDFNGFRLDVGARAGFELFFGFIGIPELALSATLGLQFEYLRTGQSTGGVSGSDTTLSISTTVQQNPWDIFTGAVSARYYF
jgi:hypothetical protein